MHYPNKSREKTIALHLSSTPVELEAMLGSTDCFEITVLVNFLIYNNMSNSELEVDIISVTCNDLKSNILPYLSAEEINKITEDASQDIWTERASITYDSSFGDF